MFWNPQAKGGAHHQRSESLSSVKTDLADDGEDEEEDEEGISIYPPEDGSLYDWMWYLITIPMVFLFVCTIADVRKPGAPKHHAYFAFVTCLAWMGLLSFYMVKGNCGITHLLLSLITTTFFLMRRKNYYFYYS